MTEQDFAPFMREAIALAEQGRWTAGLWRAAGTMRRDGTTPRWIA